jgi:DNA helicase-2/ATP-dependent DNA helicase PcrA
MNTNNTITFFGPPGTGKTFRLIQCVELQMEKNVLPRKISYLAFTKKAATESINRIQEIFHVPRSNFPYFRTIHSFAFRQLSVQREQVIGPKQLQEFGNEYGVEMSGYYDVQEDEFESRYQGYRKGDRIMFIDGLSRITGREIENIMSELELDMELGSIEIRAVAEAYQKWKTVHGLIDYTDMLEQFVERGTVPELDIVIVDEAQDLSPLQWKVIEKITENVKLVYLAGDDDQAIYRWAGADVDRFIDIPGTNRVLDQSYRTPKKIQDLANNVINRVKHRKDKEWSPRKDEGNVFHVGSSQFIEREISNGGEWLILSRNRKFLSAWKHLDEPPRVRVSTIHSAKGGEADNVVLIPDITPRVFNWLQSPDGYDDECRVFYVGITRARNNLYVMEPVTTRNFDI